MKSTPARRTPPRASLALASAVFVAVGVGPTSAARAPLPVPAGAVATAADPGALPGPSQDSVQAPLAATLVAVAPSSGAVAALARMSLPQRVGQLFMVGTPATLLSVDVVHAVQVDHVGNVMLTGRSTGGVAATAKVSARLQKLVSVRTTAGVPLFVGTDQEGGLVQVLRGPGFSNIPAALTQGSWSAASVRSYAKKWGLQLAAAGVNVDLAPVLDTVPGPAAVNPPIGRFKREYGFTPALVSSRGGAFAAGLSLAGVDPAIKHFPGLGRVTVNTDVSAGVTDHVTVRHDPYLAPFAAAVRAGAPFVMMSTAIYAKIDAARPAAFSPAVIGTILRGDLNFRGVVISDDLGNARQVAAWTPGARAVAFLRAGGDMVLTVNGALLQPMYAAVLARAKADPAFRAQVDASALRVLVAKQDRGLIPPAHAVGQPPIPASAGQQQLPDVPARLEQPMGVPGS
ncbi:MAG: beta-N-acetylhexosaminidase [Frankiales bacterium]|nr:beta-N-acetylhexosaminidase [Frankiales bacterium]